MLKRGDRGAFISTGMTRPTSRRDGPRLSKRRKMLKSNYGLCKCLIEGGEQ